MCDYQTDDDTDLSPASPPEGMAELLRDKYGIPTVMADD